MLYDFTEGIERSSLLDMQSGAATRAVGLWVVVGLACGVSSGAVLGGGGASGSAAGEATRHWVTPAGDFLSVREGEFAYLPRGGSSVDEESEAAGEAVGVGAWRIVSENRVAAVRAVGAAYLARVFESADGGIVIPTRDILIGLASGEDRAAMDAASLGVGDGGGVAEVRASALSGAIASVAASLGLGVEVETPWGSLSQARVRTDASEDSTVLALCEALSVLPGVTFAEPDMVFTGRSSYIPSDPLFGDSWGIRNTGASGGVADVDLDGDEAWDVTLGDASVLTVVIDTGVDQSHPDINQLPGIDLTGAGVGGGPVNQCDNHGTLVAGCVSAVIDNGLGTAGIAPGTRVVSVKTFNADPSCDGT